MSLNTIESFGCQNKKKPWPQKHVHFVASDLDIQIKHL